LKPGHARSKQHRVGGRPTAKAEIRRFVANPTEYPAVGGGLRFSQEEPPEPAGPIHFSLFYSSVAMPLSLRYDGAVATVAALRGPVETKSLTMFARFLEKTLLCVPEIVIKPETVLIDDVEKFIEAHESEVFTAARQFMDQCGDESILVFSFAHNFRFLANQKMK
jgi:hypothetical protein